MMQNLTPIAMPSIDKLFNDMKGLDPSILSKYVQDPDPNKKLAAMAALNSDKQIQQSAAAQQQPMPTVAQKLAQGVSQAPNMPTPGMPAVPPQAQARPAAQGIAALQPQQTPPGSAMGILPTQSAPAPQGNPSGMPVAKAAGGIASFASGGHAQQSSQQDQIAQALAQLMQGINQDTIQPLPQQAQQTGIAAPDPGKANPMQNYASMVFGTRPQYRPGTEAAPISQDLSLSQMAQYSPAQPIAAAHGGLMHHVPEHMYQFKEGGILGFAGDQKQGSQANLSPAQLDAAFSDITSNPGIIPGNTFSQAKQAAGNTYTPSNFLSNNASQADIQAARVAAYGPRQAQPVPAPAPAPAPQVSPSVAAVQNAMPAQMPDDFPGSNTDYLKQRQMALNAVAANNPQSTQQPANTGIQSVVGNTSQAPAKTAPTQSLGAPNVPASNNPANFPGQGIPTGGITDVLPKKEERRHEEKRHEAAKIAAPAVASAPEDKKSGIAAALVPPSENVTSLVDQAIMAGLKVDNAQKRFDDLAAGKKALGITDEAGDSLSEQARHFDEEYKRQDKSMEHFLKVLNGIARGGLAGGGVEEENYQTAQRLSDEAHAEKYHDMIRQAKDKTRGEKLTDLNNITAAVDADRGKAGTLAANVHSTNTQAETQRQDALLRETGMNKRAELERGVQLEIARLSREAALANKELTANDIAKELRNDPRYKNASYADVLTAAFGIKSGLTSKLSSTDLLSRIKLENANKKDFTLTQDERDEAKERLSILNKQLDQASGLAPATSQYKEGDKSTSKSGKPIVYKNGQWEYV